jgi:ubiquinone/menaquinone biosynthesis C-methylase UbiE
VTIQTYDDIAEWYDRWVSGDVRRDPLFAAVAGLLGPLAGARICDLACGQGRVARYLAELGARVVGIDASSNLLAIAGRNERAAPRGVAYLRDDAQRLGALRDAVFDGVVCQMALMDIPDLGGTIRAVARVLRSGGWFVFSTFHPCFQTPTSGEEAAPDGTLRRTVGGYWDEGFWRSDTRPGPPGKVGAHHRTLSTYVNTLVEAGLAIERVAEPVAFGEMAERRPIWKEVPATLVVRCTKSQAR